MQPALHWTAAYLGKPWVLGADGPAAYDCWGLVRAVLKARRGLDLPPIVVPQSDQRGMVRTFAGVGEGELAGWRYVAQFDVDELDAVLMAQAQHPVHVGLWIKPGGLLRVLHARQGAGVVLQDVAALRRSGYRIVDSYRYEAPA